MEEDEESSENEPSPAPRAYSKGIIFTSLHCIFVTGILAMSCKIKWNKYGVRTVALGKYVRNIVKTTFFCINDYLSEQTMGP